MDPHTDFLIPVEENDTLMHYISVLKMHPRLDGIWCNIGVEYHEEGLFDLALRCFLTAASLNSENSLALYNIALHYKIREGDFKVAGDYFRQALAADPRDASFHAALGDLYAAEENYREAAAYYKSACDLSPGNARYATELGRTYAKLGQGDDALFYLIKAYEAGPSDPDSSVSLGYYFLLYGQPERALEFAEIAMALGETAVSAMNSGHVHLIRGETHQALLSYQLSRRSYNSVGGFTADFESDFGLLSGYGISRKTYDAMLMRVLEA
jgi:tetratricopeptide (TPR) repeat protein